MYISRAGSVVTRNHGSRILGSSLSKSNDAPLLGQGEGEPLQNEASSGTQAQG